MSSNLGDQNEVLSKKVKKFLDVPFLSNWKDTYKGEIVELFISLKTSVNYSLADDFISFKLHKIIKEYFVFYFKYFLIALFKLSKESDQKESEICAEDLTISVLQKSFGLFEETKKDNFVTSRLLDTILGFLNYLIEQEKTVLEGSHKTARAILLKQFMDYCVLQKDDQPYFVKRKTKKQIIYALHQNKISNLTNGIAPLSQYPFVGKKI